MLAQVSVQGATHRHNGNPAVARYHPTRPLPVAAQQQHRQQQQQQHSLPLFQSKRPQQRTATTMAAAPASAAAGINVVGADHIVLRVADPVASVQWYSSKLGLQPVRLQEYKHGSVPFPSVRVSSTFLIDFMKQKAADAQHEVQAGAAAAPPNSGTKTSSSGGTASANLDHLCLVVGGDDIEVVKQQLAAVGVHAEQQFDGVVVKRFGAQGTALSIYVRDPDSNVVELRTYGTGGS